MPIGYLLFLHMTVHNLSFNNKSEIKFVSSQTLGFLNMNLLLKTRSNMHKDKGVRL